MLSSLCSLTLVGAGNVLALTLLRRRHRCWSWRREVQLFVLASPLVSLGLAFADQVGCQVGPCVFGGLHWSEAPERALTGAMALVALGGLALGLARLATLGRLVERASVPACPDLQALADRLASRLGTARTGVRVRAADRPLALTVGLWRPTIVVSRWMITNLDQRELEAVLAHELAHAARRDFLMLWVATVLRDAFCYLPTSWMAHRQLREEKESACDDLAVSVTRRPLGLASALAKVWQQALVAPPAAQALIGSGGIMEGRITRLLEVCPASSAQASQPEHPLAVSGGMVGGLLVLAASVILVALAVMGCNPGVFLARPL